MSGDRRTKPLSTETDMPIVFGALMIVVSERFVSVAGPLFAAHGEFLPCVSVDGAFFVYHCTRLIDALEESKSEFSRSRTTGKILNVYKYAFRPDLLPGDGAFRLANGHPYTTFVTGPIEAALRSLPLRGVRTERVWASG